MSEVPVEQRQARRREASESGWSLQIGAVLGIPIRIHFTFLLLLVYFGFSAAARGQNVVASIVFILLLFACVVLHELGHASMARAFGVRTREIVLYPIGGVAQLENIPPGVAELLIAVAGPAVNLVLAVLLFATTVLLRVPLMDDPAAVLSGGRLLPSLLFANVALFVFNLIPAFPMDGGRILRALLTLAMPEERATRIAAAIGQVIAVVFGAVGLFAWNPILIFIALFVFLGAGQEAAYHRRRAAVIGRTAREAMITRFETLAPQDSLGRAAEHLLTSHQQDFPVIDAWNRVVGVLTRSALLKGLADQGKSAAVLEVMQREVPTARPDSDLEEVLRALQSRPAAPVLVLDGGGSLVGMITLENLAEFIEVTRSSSPAGPRR